MVRLAVIDEPSRRFREEQNKDGQYSSRNNLDSKRNAPLVVVSRAKVEIGAIRSPSYGKVSIVKLF